MSQSKKLYMTTVECAEILGTSRQAVRGWIRKGILPAWQPPTPLRGEKTRGARGLYRIRREDFEEFLKKWQTKLKKT